MTFGVVAFSIVVQGLTIKPLLRVLGITTAAEDEYDRARASRMAVSAARAELDELLKTHQVSLPVYERLRGEVDARLQEISREISDMYARGAARAEAEIEAAKARLIGAEKSAIEQAARAGLISAQTAERMIEAAGGQLDGLAAKGKKTPE